MQKRHQILKLNGLDADSMGYDEVKAMVDVLIDDAIEEFKFEKKEIIHKTFPKLDKLYYMKGSEKVREYHENKEYLNKSADLKGKDVKALESGEIDPEKVNIKIENPEYISFRSRLKVLQSGKSRFAGVLDKCKDVLTQFENKKEKKDKDYRQDIHEQFDDKVNGALKTLEELRILVVHLVCLVILEDSYVYHASFTDVKHFLTYIYIMHPDFLCPDIEC